MKTTSGNPSPSRSLMSGIYSGSLFLVIALALLLLLPQPAYALVKCAVLAAENNSYLAYGTDVQSKLMATGKFSSVTVIDIYNSTPTLADLETYGSVLVYSDNSISQPGTLGDNLADYVDAGGGVVVAMFGFGITPIAGRFANDDYYALEAGSSPTDAFANATLGTIEQASSPILAGVTTFDGGVTASRSSSVTVNANAIRVADWSDGLPLIATRVIHGANRVDLNFFPPSADSGSHGWVSATDGAKIMANALVLAATPVVVVPPTEITIAPTLSITGRKKVTTAKAVYLVKGTASANATSVVVGIGTGKKVKFKVAKGTTAWSFKAHLKPGVNTITAQASDASGLKSVAVKIKVLLKS